MNAARIVTGLPVFASLDSLYYETGWETLSQRRTNKKLTLMFKIANNEIPGYLKNLLPNRVGDQTHHQLRNKQNYEVPYSRLCSYESSYFPSTLRLWNELDQDTRNSSSVLEFKNRIKSQVTDKPTNYTIPRERANELSLTRIKHNCSSLNADLNRVNIVPSALCSCGTANETAHHYFFDCNLFIVPRHHLLASIYKGHG